MRGNRLVAECSPLSWRPPPRQAPTGTAVNTTQSWRKYTGVSNAHTGMTYTARIDVSRSVRSPAGVCAPPPHTLELKQHSSAAYGANLKPTLANAQSAAHSTLCTELLGGWRYAEIRKQRFAERRYVFIPQCACMCTTPTHGACTRSHGQRQITGLCAVQRGTSTTGRTCEAGLILQIIRRCILGLRVFPGPAQSRGSGWI